MHYEKEGIGLCPCPYASDSEIGLITHFHAVTLGLGEHEFSFKLLEKGES